MTRIAITGQSHRLNMTFTALVLYAVIMLALYLVPTVLQLFLLKYFAGWVWCTLLGDLAGCFFLGLMGRWRLAVIIYVIMTGIESALVASGLIPIHTVVWIMNLVPALAIARTVYENIPSLQRR